jgi:hypothetical protein
LEFQKHIQFTRIIKAGGRLREFNFLKGHETEGAIFYVDVPDGKDYRHFLVFKQQHEDWVLEKTELPPWLEEAIPQIKKVIEDGE